MQDYTKTKKRTVRGPGQRGIRTPACNAHWFSKPKLLTTQTSVPLDRMVLRAFLHAKDFTPLLEP